MTRNGKIARLPYEIREELNHRLERNVPGITLVDWLNSLPEVQEICRDLFDGNPVIPQNLSQWRQGGFVEWQARNDLFERASEADELEDTLGLMADRASQLLATRFAIALAQWPIAPNASPSSEQVHDSPLPDSRSSPVPSSITALKPLIPLARAISQLRRADRDHAREKREQYHHDRKVRADESYAAHWAGFRREDAEKAAAANAKAASEAAAAASAQAAAPPPAPPPAITPASEAPHTRSHQITPLSRRDKKSRRAKKVCRTKRRPKKSPSPASAHTHTPNPAKPEPKRGPKVQPEDSRGCSEARTEPPVNVPKSPEPCRGDRIESPPNNVANMSVVHTEGATPLPTDPGPVPPASVPESDWELRNRALPGEPEPAWRTNLRTQKTIPPWELPECRWGDVPADSTSPTASTSQTPLKAILARAGS